MSILSISAPWLSIYYQLKNYFGADCWAVITEKALNFTSTLEKQSVLYVKVHFSRGAPQLDSPAVRDSPHFQSVASKLRYRTPPLAALLPLKGSQARLREYRIPTPVAHPNQGLQPCSRITSEFLYLLHPSPCLILLWSMGWTAKKCFLAKKLWKPLLWKIESFTKEGGDFCRALSALLHD